MVCQEKARGCTAGQWFGSSGPVLCSLGLGHSGRCVAVSLNADHLMPSSFSSNFFFLVLGTEPRALHVLGQSSTTEPRLYPLPAPVLIIIVYVYVSMWGVCHGAPWGGQRTTSCTQFSLHFYMSSGDQPGLQAGAANLFPC